MNNRYIYCYRILQAIDFLDRVYKIFDHGVSTPFLFGSKEIKELISRNHASTTMQRFIYIGMYVQQRYSKICLEIKS